MVRYYDLFMRFLVIVGLASLLIGGVSVWTGISAYVAERANVIAVLRSMGADRARIFIHFFAQVAALAAIGVGIGLLVGASVALRGAADRRPGGRRQPARPTLHAEPLLVAAGVGLHHRLRLLLPAAAAGAEHQPGDAVPLQGPRGAADRLARRWLRSFTHRAAGRSRSALFFWLAIIMTDDPLLVAAFALGSGAVGGALPARHRGASYPHRAPARARRTALLRHALRDIAGAGSNAPSVVVSVGLALAMLVVVLVLQVNLRNEYLGASVFDAPTFVASDLFDDEVAALEALEAEGGDITAFTATPMLRGTLSAPSTATPAAELQTARPRGLVPARRAKCR